MDVTTLTSLISSFGFPIVACVAMGYYINKINKEHSDDIKELNKEHKNEINGITEALNNNTVALEKLIVAIDKQGVNHDN